MHHIISQARCRKLGREDWINNNPGNIVELCEACHDQTTASITSEINRDRERRGTSKFRIDKIIEGGGDKPEICWAMLKNGKKRCGRKNTKDGLCWMHHKTIRMGVAVHKPIPEMAREKNKKS